MEVEGEKGWAYEFGKLPPTVQICQCESQGVRPETESEEGGRDRET